MEITDNIAVLILAAGSSFRMKEFKPLMKLGNITAVEHSVRCFYYAGINDIRIVLGYNALDVIETLKYYVVRFIFNKRFHEEMFTSVQWHIIIPRDLTHGNIPTKTLASQRQNPDSQVQVVVLVEVLMPTMRTAIENYSVKKTLSIPQWLNKLAVEKNINFSHLLQTALKEQLGIRERR